MTFYIVEYLGAVFPAYGYFETPEAVAAFADEVMFPKAEFGRLGARALPEKERQGLVSRVRAYPLKRGGDYENDKPEGFEFGYRNQR